jgi:acyl-CoA thioesterase
MEKIKRFFAEHDKFAAHAGIVLDEVGAGWAKVSMKIEPCHYNGAQTVHGGALFTLADFAFAAASNSHGQLAMGISTSMNFIKAAITGTLHAEAREVAKNAKLGTYTVTISDDAGDTVAIFQGMVYRKSAPLIPPGTAS